MESNLSRLQRPKVQINEQNAKGKLVFLFILE
jgi:hypothetical protein